MAGVTAAALAAVPLVYLVVRVTEGSWERFASVLLRPRTADLLTTSLGLALAVGAGAALVGTATAMVMARCALPAARLWPVLATAPLAVPSYVTAFAWVATWPGARGFWLLVVVLSLSTAPFVTLPTYAALTITRGRGESVARTLGLSRIAVFARVTLPTIAPAIAAGTLLASLYALSDFGAPAMLRVETLTSSIRVAYEGGLDRSLAAVQALVLVALAIPLAWGERLVHRRTATTYVTAAPFTPPTIGRRRWLAVAGLLGVVAASVLLPVVALIRRAVSSINLTVNISHVADAAWNSFTMGFAGAGIAVALALPIATLAVRWPGRVSGVLQVIAVLGQSIPGIVVGLSLVFFTLRVVPPLYQSAVALAFAYGVIFLPKALGSSKAAIGRASERYEEVARTLGASRWSAWRRVTLCVAAPGVVAGGLLAAVTAMKELPATLMLRPTGMDTLATAMWQKTSVGYMGEAAPYALALVIVGSLPALALSRMVKHT